MSVLVALLLYISLSVRLSVLACYPIEYILCSLIYVEHLCCASPRKLEKAIVGGFGALEVLYLVCVCLSASESVFVCL